MYAPLPPLAVADLSPELLSGVSRVHAVDPRSGGPGVQFAIPGRAWPASGAGGTLVVHIEQHQAAADLAALRSVIDLAAGLRGERGRVRAT